MPRFKAIFLLIIMMSMVKSKTSFAQVDHVGHENSIDFKVEIDDSDASYYPVFTQGQMPLIHLLLRGTSGLFSNATLVYEVHDYWDERVDKGSCLVNGSADRTRITLKPKVRDIGWYRLSVHLMIKRGKVTPVYAVTQQAKAMDMGDYLTFAIVPDVSNQQQKIGPIGLDAAIAIRERSQRQRLVEMARLTGCRWVRDRISWRAFNPSPGKYKWELYDDLFAMYKKAGLPILLAYASSPQWTRQYGEKSYPSDLWGAYQFAKDCVEHWGDRMFAWEIWNEPDIAVHSKEPPDRFAAMLKAISLGYRSGANDPVILQGPIAREPGPFSQSMFANNVADYVDVYSFHSYAPFESNMYERVVDQHLQSASANGFSESWMTEIGRAFARDKKPDPLLASREQADYLVRAYTTSLSMGIRRVSWFILRPYLGGGPSQFGLLRLDLSPLPSYQAMAVMCQQLGNATALGDVRVNAGSLHVFDHGKYHVAVVLPDKNNPMLKPDTLRLTSASQIVDLMGRQIPANLQTFKQQIMDHPGQPFYVTHVKGSQFNSAKPTSQTIAKHIAKAPGVVALCRVDLNRVISEAGEPRTNWDAVITGWSPLSYRIEPGLNLEIPIDFYNFQNKPTSLNVTLRVTDAQVKILPATWTMQLDSMSMQTFIGRIKIPEIAKPFDMKLEAEIDGQVIPLAMCQFQPADQ